MERTKKDISPGTAGTDGSLDGQRSMSDPQSEGSATSEESLVSRCRAGNMAAFGELVERYQHRLFNAIVRLVGNHDDAEEITQEAFVRALQGLKRFRGNSRFYTWLFRIGMNLGINLVRRRGRVKMQSLDGSAEHGGGQAAGLLGVVEDDTESPTRQVEMKEAYENALAALAELEPETRAVVVLRDIEQLSYAQIGRIMVVPVGTVKSRLFRARMMLRERLVQRDTTV